MCAYLGVKVVIGVGVAVGGGVLAADPDVVSLQPGAGRQPVKMRGEVGEQVRLLGGEETRVVQIAVVRRVLRREDIVGRHVQLLNTVRAGKACRERERGLTKEGFLFVANDSAERRRKHRGHLVTNTRTIRGD